MRLTVYVPRDLSDASLIMAPGSAVVGTPDPAGRVVIDYEGNRHGAMKDWDEMILHAADRHRTRYATVARAHVWEADLVAVGTYETDTHELVVDDRPTLDRWRERASAPRP